MLCKVFLTFMSVDETLVCDHSNESYWEVLSCGTVYHAVQMKAIEQYFHVVLFIMLCKVILTFRFVHEALVCDNLNQSTTLQHFFYGLLFIMLCKVDTT